MSENKEKSREKLVIANWKMKLSLEESKLLASAIAVKFRDHLSGVIAVCPSFISLTAVKEALADTPVKLGAQDVFWEEYGAYTGEICPSMLADAGCEYVIVGHSERRKFLMVNYEMIHRTVKAILAKDSLTPIVCIGENWDERKTDRRDYVLYDQLQQALTGLNIVGNQQIIVAYEPIWAIGSGTAIEPSEAEYAHKIIRLTLNDMFGQKIVNNNFRIIYGGSINAENISSFSGLESVDGLLVGGASLDAEEFFKVVNAFIKQ